MRSVSNLHSKTLVYSAGLPLPFSIYEGIGETLYMVSNSVAYSSVCSPGLYKTMRTFFSAIKHEGKRVIIDDILGMTGGDPADGIVRPVFSGRFISMLSALNRLSWKVNHKEAANVDISSTGVYWQATPLAFLHDIRLEDINTQKINAAQDSWFIIPVGCGEKVATAVTFMLTFVQRDVYVAHIAASVIDDTYVVIPPRGVSTLPVVSGLHVSKPQRPLRSAKGAWCLDNEKKLYAYLYG